MNQIHYRRGSKQRFPRQFEYSYSARGVLGAQREDTYTDLETDVEFLLCVIKQAVRRLVVEMLLRLEQEQDEQPAAHIKRRPVTHYLDLNTELEYRWQCSLIITELELRGKCEAYSMAGMILELVEITLDIPYDLRCRNHFIHSLSHSALVSENEIGTQHSR